MVKTPDITTLKKSKMLSNLPKWLVVTQIVLFGSQDLEIRSHVSSFSAQVACKDHFSFKIGYIFFPGFEVIVKHKCGFLS